MPPEEDEKKLVIIVDERRERMVSHTGGMSTVRLARFLKPSVSCTDQLPPLPNTEAYHHESCPFVAHFKGWRSQQKKWKQWVDDLKPKYGSLWKKVHIYDSIITSTYEILKHKELVLGLAECWCPDTNTFVFTWGEATMTLEDMLVLGGFSILGEPVTSPLTGELLKIEKKLVDELRVVCRSKAKKADHAGWIRHFMGRNDDLEHTAFISLWLSRYVFHTKPEETMSKTLFPIAIHLSQATQIALAPAVLASLYRDLRILKEKFDVSSTKEECDIVNLSVWAPFQILQLWVWERFPSLQPAPNSISLGEPRSARWHKLKIKSTVALVRRRINSHDDFQWRPYSPILDNWQHPLYNKRHSEWVIVSCNMKDEFVSLARCFIPCELVGIDCLEQYVPHRVGMQFGMDQDIPGPFLRASANSKIAWKTFDMPLGNISFYIPPRLFESDVTVQYLDWWERSSSNKSDEVKSIPVPQLSSPSPEVSPKSSESENSASPPPGIACKRWWEDQSSRDEDKMTLSKWFKCQGCNVTVDDRALSSGKCPSIAQAQSSSSTSKEKAAESNLSNRASKKHETISEEDNHMKEKNSSDICSEAYHCEQQINTNIFLQQGLKLEMRIHKLEIMRNWLQAKGTRTTVEAHLICRSGT